MPLLPSSRKGLGLIFDDRRESGGTYGLERLRLAPASRGQAFTLENYIPEVDGNAVILDQQASSSCVLHAFIGAIHIAETQAGLPFVPCSRRFPYYNALRLDTPKGLIADTGTYLHTGAQALRAFGVPDEKFWPWSQLTHKLIRRPDFNAMRYAHPRAGGQYVKVYEQGEHRVNAIIAALHAGHCVGFGTRLGVSFLDNHGPHEVPLPDVTEKVAGNHAMLIVGYRRDNLGRLWFRVLNSWGALWRDGGLCWMSESYVKWVYTQDLHIIYGWPRLQGVA